MRYRNRPERRHCASGELPMGWLIVIGVVAIVAVVIIATLIYLNVKATNRDTG